LSTRVVSGILESAAVYILMSDVMWAGGSKEQEAHCLIVPAYDYAGSASTWDSRVNRVL